VKKAPGRAQGHRTRGERARRAPLALVPVVAEHHPPPADLLPAILREWHAFWETEFARVINWDRDHRALWRLFELYSLRQRLQTASSDVFLEGSQGQTILNPALRHLSTVGTEISSLEQQFGLTPKSAASLGLSLGGLRKTLEDRNREANQHAARKTRRA